MRSSVLVEYVRENPYASAPEGDPDVFSGWLDVPGTSVSAQSVTVADPCMLGDNAAGLNLPEGGLLLQVQLVDMSGMWGRRIAAARLILEGFEGEPVADEVLAGGVGVDTGTVAFVFGDPSDAREDLLCFRPDLSDMAGVVVLNEEGELAVGVPSGIGDGFYPIERLRDAGGNLVGLQVRFLGADEGGTYIAGAGA
jgi:hypothetical protein